MHSAAPSRHNQHPPLTLQSLQQLMTTINVKVRRKRLAYNDSMRYVARPLRYSLIETDELIRLAADNTQMSPAQLAGAFYALSDAFHTLLCNGHSIRLGPIGIFRFSFSCSATGERCEMSGKKVGQRRIIFLPGKDLKKALQHITFCGFDETGATDTPPADDAPNTSESATGSAGETPRDAQADVAN